MAHGSGRLSRKLLEIKRQPLSGLMGIFEHLLPTPMPEWPCQRQRLFSPLANLLVVFIPGH